MLRKGDKGKDVEILQHLLGNRGYFNGYADGIFGDETERAVKAFQLANGLKDDGVVGPATDAALAKDPSGNTKYLLRKGDKGESVRQLQQALIDAGYNIGSSGVDGDFGQGTYNAVVKFQGDHNLDKDGIVGPATWNALSNAKNEGGHAGILKLGSRGKDVEILQHLLGNRGYLNGAADGIFGPETERAVKAFQRDNGLKDDGVVGPATNAALAKDPSGHTEYLLKKGSRGESVRQLQQALINAGYNVGTYGVDGVFGDGTYNAVVKFQGDHNLDADGIVGPKTWKALKGAKHSGNFAGLLRLGNRGENVVDLQELLIKAGYSVGSAGADGIFGQGTYNAVIKFQGDHNLDRDGIVGPATWGALRGGSSSGYSGGLLRLGSRGGDVEELQRLLIKAGYSVGSAGVDGIFGQGTYNAVIKFQGDHNLDRDGIVGPATWGALGGRTVTNISGGPGVLKFVKVAEAQEFHERIISSDGEGDNMTPYGAWYGSNGVPWCAMFVSWCANQAGILGTIVPRYSYCGNAVNWYRARGRYRTRQSGYIPKVGDVIFYYDKTKTEGPFYHTGIVTGYDSSSKEVITTEGNKNQAVRHNIRHSINWKDIHGYGDDGGIKSDDTNEGISRADLDKINNNELSKLLGVNFNFETKEKVFINSKYLKISYQYADKINIGDGKAFSFEYKNGKFEGSTMATGIANVMMSFGLVEKVAFETAIKLLGFVNLTFGIEVKNGKIKAVIKTTQKLNNNVSVDLVLNIEFKKSVDDIIDNINAFLEEVNNCLDKVIKVLLIIVLIGYSVIAGLGSAVIRIIVGLL